MKWITLLTLLLQLLTGALFAQEYTFQGTIIDENTGEPIPFAHCQILPDRATGFVADFNGSFSHQSKEKELEVVVTAISYEPKRVGLTEGSNQLIQLEAASFAMNEIVVTYVDHERAMLQKVLESIPKNYPQKSERITGRVIEQLATDSSCQNLIYSADAIIEADKLNYSKRNRYGTVRVVDGDVEVLEPLNSSFTNIVAGAHNVHRFDVIAARFPPFDNIQSKKYQFQLVDTLSYMGQALFKMQFETVDYEGDLYIQDSTFALVKAVFNVKKDRMSHFPGGGDSERLFVNGIIEYFKEDDFFRLSFINYQTGFSKKDADPAEQIYLNNFFYLNKHHPLKKSIPYKDHLGFSSKLITELDVDSTALQDENKKDFKKNFSIDMGFSLLKYRLISRLSVLQDYNLDAELRNQKYRLLTTIGLNYQINNIWSVGYTGGFYINDKLSSHTLLLNWTYPITKNRRWLIGIGTGLNYFKANLNIGSGTPFGELLQNTILTNNTAQIREESRQFNLLTHLQLKYQLVGNIFATFGSSIPLDWQNKVKVTTSQDDNSVLLYESNIRNGFQWTYHQYSLGLLMHL